MRANALESNLLYFRVVKGKRTVLRDVGGVPTATKQWQTLVVELRGAHLHVEVDGAPKLDDTLDAPPHGRLGLWSKADSRVLFDDFTVTPLSP